MLNRRDDSVRLTLIALTSRGRAERRVLNRIMGIIKPEDYLEPRCPLDCSPASAAHVQSIPQRRVLDKLDEYLAKRDYAGAERHLLYWQEEARQGNDLQGQLLICNELIGHYRKNGQKEQSYRACTEAVRLMEALGFSNQVSGGTTFVNMATAYSAFGDDEEALRLFSRAREIYESYPKISPELLGGLYNNMGLCCAALGKYSMAKELFFHALELSGTIPGGELEQAITRLNLADCLVAEQGISTCEAQIRTLLDQVKHDLLETNAKKDGYYAFVCEKCAAGFQDYGYSDTAEKLRELAEQIYEGA